CQPCKRQRRLNEAVQGEPSLAGFGAAGPVYAIVRNKGAEGQGTYAGADLDQCQGGFVTWGRGDGQAVRDVAIATLGRTQNICADSYRDFMQRVVTDIVALSSPYPLAGAPIAATIEVGIARSDGSG